MGTWWNAVASGSHGGIAEHFQVVAMFGEGEGEAVAYFSESKAATV
jgi:hypothetical protein